MNDVVTLVLREYEGQKYTDHKRTVFCGIKSVGYREFYASVATDYRPEIVFLLADYLDYAGETLAIYRDQWFRILRVYRTGKQLQLTAERAARDEVGL